MKALPTLSRYVVRRIFGHLLGIAVVVVAISVLRRLSGLLIDAADGSLPPDLVFSLLSLRTAASAPSLLPAAFYIAIVVALGRMHEDQEITALESCGVSPFRLAPAILLLAAVVGGVVAVLSLETAPWATARFHRVKQRATQTLEISELQPRRFYEIGPEGRQVLFARARNADGRMSDVFVQLRQEDGTAIFSGDELAESLDRATGERLLELSGGYRYDLRPTAPKFEITEYRDLTIRVRPDEDPEPRGPDGTPTTALLASGDPASIAELEWRLSMPLSTLVLALLAISLSRVERGQSRYARLFVAVLIYLVYHQLLVTSRHWVSDGQLAVFPGLGWVHGAFLLAGLAFVARQSAGGGRSRSRGPTRSPRVATSHSAPRR